MYWTDTVLDRISRAALDGSNVEIVVEHGVHTADGLAVDSVGRKIYWTDDGHNRLQVGYNTRGGFTVNRKKLGIYFQARTMFHHVMAWLGVNHFFFLN